jgi:hypothetical protein
MTDTDSKPAPTPVPAKQDDHVFVRILPKGHDLVFTGEVDPVTNRPTKHPKGHTFVLHVSIAKELEERGFAEIVPE